MNTDKAYLLGLIIGGGIFSTGVGGNRRFSIKLPYKQWGDVATNPARAGEIARDILRVVQPPMEAEYGLSTAYVTGRTWFIDCNGDTSALVNNLHTMGVRPTSKMWETSSISGIVPLLVDTNLKRRFIAGIADTIGSMAPSHRRFTDDVQIISFEISGFNYRFVCELCNLLYSIGCIPDQILWQHPNMQSGKDAYYRQWKKGNKLRVTLDAFSEFGALGFRSKSNAARENLERQHNGRNAAELCENKPLKRGITAVHVDESYAGIPEDIRGGHYVHHKQICAALGCEHAPYREVGSLIRQAYNSVFPYTVLTKGDAVSISNIIASEPLFLNRTYTDVSVRVSNILDAIRKNENTFVFTEQGLVIDTSRTGYPTSQIADAVAFILASQTGQLNGNRVRGNRDDLLSAVIDRNPLITVTIKVPDKRTPLLITDGHVSALVGPKDPDLCRRLITVAPDNQYKLVLRKPTEEDL